MVQADKPMLFQLEKISVKEFFYLQSLSYEVGTICDIKNGYYDKSIFIVSYRNQEKIAYIHEDDIRIVSSHVNE